MFSEKQQSEFLLAYEKASADLQDLKLQHVVQGQPLQSEGVREHLLHGAARRIGVLHRSLAQIFELFPLDRTRPLASETLADVQINLHAFVINLSGIFDNWAWAYVLHHNLLKEIGDRRRVGLFHTATTSRLPTKIREYLSNKSITDWQSSYLKNYRDALAHRIPLYIPPAEFTPAEGAEYNTLEDEKAVRIKEMNWPRLQEIYDKQATLGAPSFTFLHSFAEEEPSRQIYMHPQLVTDAQSVVEFGNLFLEHWHESA